MTGKSRYVPKNKGKGKAAKWLFDHADYAGGDCLIWPFSRIWDGYGTFGYLGKHYYAHRFMCELVNGPAPPDKTYASHNCGKGHYGCVNRNHLEWKTPTDNQLDRAKHGTKAKGVTGRLATFSESQVLGMRALKGILTQTENAIWHNTTRSTIRYWLDGNHMPVPQSQSYQAQRRRIRLSHQPNNNT